MVPNGEITPLFEAVVNATEESIINALVAGRTMVGHDGHKIVGINHKRYLCLIRPGHSTL